MLCGDFRRLTNPLLPKLQPLLISLDTRVDPFQSLHALHRAIRIVLVEKPEPPPILQTHHLLPPLRELAILLRRINLSLPSAKVISQLPCLSAAKLAENSMQHTL